MSAAPYPGPGLQVMSQQWRSLLFLHWQYPAEEIRRALPPDLEVDTFEGRAFLGVVPFFMRNVRPRFLPPVPVLSNFLELNLRTYVRDERGVSGVRFFSLDANQPLAVWVARSLFHLPYFHARMQASAERSGAVRFSSRRDNASGEGCRFHYAPEGSSFLAREGSLEHFLVERYRLFSSDARGRLMLGTVAHKPYQLFHSRADSQCDDIFRLNGFDPPARPPDHVLMSPGVDVSVHRILRA